MKNSNSILQQIWLSFILLFSAYFLPTNFCFANNIQVSNVVLRSLINSATDNFSLVQFNLNWDNSWRTATNWDAAWVFVKFRAGVSNPTFSGINSGTSTTITVNSTVSLRVGMPVLVTTGTGAFATNTVISSIPNATQFIVSATPTTGLSEASIECIRIWEHAYLDNSGNTAPNGYTINAGLLSPTSAFNATTNPGLGTFIYRTNSGSGQNSINSVQLRWNYGANGLSDDALVDIRVFAIEMVYVPTGTFSVGGASSGSAFNSTTGSSITGSNIFPTGSTSPNSSWPNGYSAFYCMKYELSQGQYRDFLNSLTYGQQLSRTANLPSSAPGTGALITGNSSRNGIDIEISGSASSLSPALYACNLTGNSLFNESTDGEWLACNFFTWMDQCAYLDWSGLRPMTEMEYEKACRGTASIVSGEYAWGTTSVSSTALTLSSVGSISEGINTGYNTTANTGNSLTTSTRVSASSGPLRVGVFAGNISNTGRVSAGATFYGIMEMSGSLLEQIVNIGSGTATPGGAYTGSHGNGSISPSGNANVNLWPGTVSGEVTSANSGGGSGYRGGDFANSNILYIRVADRQMVSFSSNSRSLNVGIRGVRSAQ